MPLAHRQRLRRLDKSVRTFDISLYIHRCFFLDPATRPPTCPPTSMLHRKPQPKKPGKRLARKRPASVRPPPRSRQECFFSLRTRSNARASREKAEYRSSKAQDVSNDGQFVGDGADNLSGSTSCRTPSSVVSLDATAVEVARICRILANVGGIALLGQIVFRLPGRWIFLDVRRLSAALGAAIGRRDGRHLVVARHVELSC